MLTGGTPTTPDVLQVSDRELANTLLRLADSVNVVIKNDENRDGMDGLHVTILATNYLAPTEDVVS
jgi:hypothetical protein